MPAIRQIAADALDICRAATLAFDSPTGETTPLPPSAVQQIGDVAFIGTTEMRSTSDRLSAIQRASRDEALDECQRVLRRVLKTLSALDAALADASNEPSRLDIGGDLIRSIATRRHYARLRRMIIGYPIPESPEASRRAFERLRIHLTLLAESDEYDGLRLGDRRRVEELRARIATQLALSDDAPGYFEDAKRLWQDALGFARLVAAISRRHELVESDTRVIATAHASLASSSEIAPRLRARLDMLAGLDDAVDSLLDAGDWSPVSWREVLADLHERIVRPATGRFRVIEGPMG